MTKNLYQNFFDNFQNLWSIIGFYVKKNIFFEIYKNFSNFNKILNYFTYIILEILFQKYYFKKSNI